MKKLLCFVMVIIMVIPVCVLSVAADDTNILLSEMSDEECLAFLKNQGVTIPDEFENELSWGPFIKEIITLVENNPNVTFAYNYSVTQAFANAIKSAVNEYYDVTAEILPASNMRVANPALIYSEVYGVWSDSFEDYNCYSYALGITDEWLNPGNLSGFVYSLSLSVITVADYAKADLEELGYTNVTITSTRPTTATLGVHQKAICARIKGGVDYHFMKLDGNSWYHKPSNTNILRYKHLPNEDLVWTNECSYKGIIYIPTVEYTSSIRYIIYTTPHEYEFKPCGNNQHIKTCTICQATTGVAANCIYVNGRCKVCKGYQTITTSLGEYSSIALVE